MCDDLPKHIEELEILVSMIKHDVINLLDGNKHASVDARKRLSTISKLSSTIRAECLSIAKPKKAEDSKDPEIKLDVVMSFSPSETERLNEIEKATKGCSDPVGLVDEAPTQPEADLSPKVEPKTPKSRVRKPKMSRKKKA
jgi:hypothetical protein